MSDTPGPGRPLVEYPADYELKVIGRPEDDFEGRVRALVAAALGAEVPEDAVGRVPSSRGSYVSLRVTVRLESEAQRRSVYAALQGDERVLYLL